MHYSWQAEFANSSTILFVWHGLRVGGSSKNLIESETNPRGNFHRRCATGKQRLPMENSRRGGKSCSIINAPLRIMIGYNIYKTEERLTLLLFSRSYSFYYA
ncbi:hypothetical protein NPIL_241461 [Nephila pilipes]|uniref:Uncharacterized protein n=1 Tax=Nephila pilipes TaxID=299642 RepID=A0A8X6NPR8_NEPPI|nr:hypothetical protein NPIL_241461 [Nephila pilipes]